RLPGQVRPGPGGLPDPAADPEGQRPVVRPGDPGQRVDGRRRGREGGYGMSTRRTRPTLDEVAALAGVGRGTVSRVINGSAHVSPRARAAVERAIAQLGYVPKIGRASCRERGATGVA